MILSGLFVRHKEPAPRFAPALFLAFLAGFTVVGQIKPVMGLVGLGTTAILTAVLIELNRKRIWMEYLKIYKKRKGLKGAFTKPNELYYNINVWFLWPFIFFLGLICLWVAYAYA
ncbi:MAG TPA: hypothetical protein VI322_02940 [Candidatus Saccharimonadia bacterium]